MNYLEKNSVMDVFKVIISIIIWLDQPDWRISRGVSLYIFMRLTKDTFLENNIPRFLTCEMTNKN